MGGGLDKVLEGSIRNRILKVGGGLDKVLEESIRNRIHSDL